MIRPASGPGDESGNGHRQEHDGRLQCAALFHQLQVLAQYQFHAYRACGAQAGCREGAGEIRQPEQRQVDERMFAALLTPKVRRDEHHAEQRCDQQRRQGSALSREFLDGIHQRSQSDQDLQRPDEIPWRTAWRGARWHQPQRQHQRDRNHGHIDQEYRAPPEMFQQQARDQRPQRHAACRHA